jgi:DNA-binding response OmpR family regulator
VAFSRAKGRFKALIVQPERARAGIMIEAMRAVRGCDPISAPSLEEALGHLESADIPLIVVSEKLAPIDAFEFVKLYRNSTRVLNPRNAAIILFDTVDRAKLAQALGAGADAVLTYPLSIGALEGVLSAIEKHPRPFIRTPSYSGPCRRRGLAPGAVGAKRLEDVGGGDLLHAAFQELQSVFDQAVLAKGKWTAPEVEEAARLPADLFGAYFAKLSDGDAGVQSAITARCLRLVSMFLSRAHQEPDFDVAVGRLRKLISANVVAHAQSA